MEESSSNYLKELSSDDESLEENLNMSRSSCGWDRTHRIAQGEENKSNGENQAQPSKEEQKKDRAKDKKLEKDAVQKLGISNFEDLLEYFEESEKEKFLRMFKIKKVLGSGGFGVVVAARDIQFNKDVALKIVYRKDLKSEMLMYEYEVLRELKHDNIIKIYSLFNFQNFVVIDEDCAQIMTGVFRGLAYLHGEKDMIHRDLKPANIVIPDPNNLTKATLIDFGIASQNKRQQMRKYGNIGTLVYQPPEQMNNKMNYGKMADIWACGIIVFYLLTNKHPFIQGNDNTDEIKNRIMNFKEIKFPKNVSQEARHLIARLCTHEQSHRYSAGEALRHPWITRDFSAKPPLTKAENKNQIGEELMIENKLRKIQSTVFFMAAMQYMNHPNKNSLIDYKYKMRLRAQDMTEVVIRQRTLKGSLLSRKIVPPSIDVVKTSSLAKRDLEREKNGFDSKNKKRTDSSAKDKNSSMNTSQDFIEFSKSVNMEILSPDVKEFLRKNRIRVRKESQQQEQQRGERSSSKVKMDLARKQKSLAENHPQLLNVPEYKKKKKSYNVTDRSLSPNSPAELRMNVSGDFSDIMTSDDEAASNSSHQSRPSGQQRSNQMTKLLPNIDEKKSIQAKNYATQPKDILQKIKQQQVIQPKDIKKPPPKLNNIPATQSMTYTELRSQQQSQMSQKRPSSRPAGSAEFIQSLINSNAETPVHTYKTGNLIQMMQDQIKDQEERKKSFGKQGKQKTFKNSLPQHRPSPSAMLNSNGDNRQSIQIGGGQHGIVTFDFNQGLQQNR